MAKMPMDIDSIQEVRSKIAAVNFQSGNQTIAANAFKAFDCTQQGSTDLTGATLLGIAFASTGTADCVIYSMNGSQKRVGILNTSSSQKTINAQMQLLYLLK